MKDKEMVDQLHDLMKEVLGDKAPDVKKELKMKKARKRRRLRKGRRLTFKEVNEAAEEKKKVWVIYFDRDGRTCEDVFVASRTKRGGWDFDGGLGAVIVEPSGEYGPVHDGKSVKKPKPGWPFEAQYVQAVHEAR